MATVYKAFDTRLDRDVAIKIIRKEAFPLEQLGRILRRFEREAKALARLSHPNIIGILDYGDYKGSPYLVMEFLPSGTLKKRLGKPIPWREAARLLLPIARALQFAHDQGIIHRDIKPSNILITLSGEPMISDFGIAKILEEGETATLTGTGIGVGTPEYMAPEQWTGKATRQSDIYSLGVVFYEMITGHKPYTADTPAAILLKQAHEPLPRPIEYVSDLPNTVEKVLIKSLSNKAEYRFQSMEEFSKAVDHLLEKQTSKVLAELKSKTNIEEINKHASRPSINLSQERMKAIREEEKTKDELSSHTKNNEQVSGSPLPPTKHIAKMGSPRFLILTVVLASAGLISLGGLGLFFNQAHNQKIAQTATTQAQFITDTAQALFTTATAQEVAYKLLVSQTKKKELEQSELSKKSTTTAEARILGQTSTAMVCLGTLFTGSISLCDSFDDNGKGWWTGEDDTSYWKGNGTIEGGKYIWKVLASKTGFLKWAYAPAYQNISDFFISVEAKLLNGPIGTSCYGLLFRGDSSNYYRYEVCEDGKYKLVLHDGSTSQWKNIITPKYSKLISSNHSNKLAVIGTGSHYSFYINNQLLDEATDNSRNSGFVALVIEMEMYQTAIFEFDNFVLAVPNA